MWSIIARAPRSLFNFAPTSTYNIMKSFTQFSVDNSNVAINLHSLTGQRTFERMLTQMELMHSVVDLDRPISIHGEQIAETLIT
ncbi:hypothetical protein X777_07314 [Ooceraea biroi]|uniref:Uncharacterized protein n=1 Tax=Ooceraea biroi TaxID=2015173 RepID=A0A026X0Y2_OOCBI|nr:hypothetical protein X777_07314 [Ooceraea biroi]